MGGYKMGCVPPSYDTKGSLSVLHCFFGKTTGTKDLADPEKPVVPNELVYLSLKSGFMKKFREPNVKQIPMRTGFGIQHTNEEAIWIDRQAMN